MFVWFEFEVRGQRPLKRPTGPTESCGIVDISPGGSAAAAPSYVPFPPVPGAPPLSPSIDLISLRFSQPLRPEAPLTRGPFFPPPGVSNSGLAITIVQAGRWAGEGKRIKVLGC